MKNIHIQKMSRNRYIFDRGDDSASGHFELSMNRSPTGQWVIEVTDLTEWEAKTTFLWVAETAREAVKDCMHSLRYIERHHKLKKRA